MCNFVKARLPAFSDNTRFGWKYVYLVCSLGINFLDKSAFSISLYVILNYILNQRMEMWLKSRLLTFIQEVESKNFALTVSGLQSFLYAVPKVTGQSNNFNTRSDWNHKHHQLLCFLSWNALLCHCGLHLQGLLVCGSVCIHFCHQKLSMLCWDEIRWLTLTLKNFSFLCL